MPARAKNSVVTYALPLVKLGGAIHQRKNGGQGTTVRLPVNVIDGK